MTKYSAEDTARGLDPDNVPDEPGAALHSPTRVGTGLDDGGDYGLVFPPEGKIAQTAKALNDAAGDRLHTIIWTDGAFRAPQDIIDAASLPGGATEVNTPNPTGSSSPTVRENGFGNYVSPDLNDAAVVADPATVGGSSAHAPAESVTPRRGRPAANK